MTLEAANYFDNFVVSTVLGDDMVPRLSKNSMEHLKKEVKIIVV